METEGSDDSWGWNVASDDELPSRPSPSRVSNLRAESPYENGAEEDPRSVVDETEPLLSSPRRGGNMGALDASTTDLVVRKPQHKHQFIVAVAATFGSLAMGAVLGYSSPAGPQLAYDVEVNKTCGGDLSNTLNPSQISWFGSTVNIGALIGAPLAGFSSKTIGRRLTMSAILVPFLLGWILTGTAYNFTMLLFGRIFLGVCAGAVSFVVPTYIGEIASSDIRGLLSTGFQVMTCTGILFAYAVGAGLCWQWLSLACLVPAVIFGTSMYFSPESPNYLVTKKREEEAKKTLEYLRGKRYDVQPELEGLKKKAEEERMNKATLADLKKPYIMRPLIISLSLMLFQQTSGINAILFNLTAIFKSANSSMSPEVSSILIALMQVIMTLVAAGLMDKAGRKLLLLISSAAMAVSLVMMGVFFYLDEQEEADSIGWLPLLSLIIFISFFSIGFGPVPWCIMGEVFPSEVREIAGTLTTLTNWFMSFCITLLYEPMRSGMGDAGVYWFFAGMCVVSFIFCFFVVKETKGKTINEIAEMFGGAPVDRS